MEIIQFDFDNFMVSIMILLGFVFLCRLAFVFKWLTTSGSIAAFFMAILILIRSDFTFFYLPLLLLVGGSFLSKLNADESEKKGRNIFQVLANGGIAAVCLLFPYPEGVTFFVISFTISICDTFSSEIGKYFSGKTIDILSLKPIRMGLSGGISFAGTMGGLAGVVLCSFIAIYAYKFEFYDAVLVGITGMAGMFIDSVLGSKFQAKYINKNGEISEQKMSDNKLFKGYVWCTNDVVNMLSNAITLGFLLVLGKAGLF